MATSPKRLSQFWQELKRRKILPFLIGYVAACFAIIEFFDITSERFTISDNTFTLLYVLAVAGLPIVIVLPWIINKRKEEGQVTTNVDTQDSLKSLIVLPFEDLSPEKDQDYFSDGLTEEIITDLSHIQDLLVISRSSAMTFKGTKKKIREIAKDVNVGFVLEGSVRKAGDDLRITAQLIDASSDVHLWAEKYNGTLHDVFNIQEEVSRSIVEALKLTLTDNAEKNLGVPVKDVKAYEYYLKARQTIDSFTEDGVKNAIQYLESALQTIGENSTIYAGLGYAWWQYYNITSKRDAIDNSIGNAEKAIELDPDSSEAHFVLGNVYIYSILANLKKGITHLQKSLEVNPNNCEAIFHLAGVYLILGKSDLAVPLIERHLIVDPLSFYGYWISGCFQLYTGNFARALKDMDRAYELGREIPSTVFFYALILIYNGKKTDAIAVIEEGERVLPDSIFIRVGIILKYALLGKKEKAIRLITTDILEWGKNDAVNPWFIIAVYSLLDENDEILNWLEIWVERGFVNYPFLTKYDILIESVRDEERYIKLMETVKHEWKRFEV